jgi:ubiquinone/menaquinone biosynthesis C-methylase UbiE
VSSETTRFVGSVPALYERHLGPVLFEPYARDLARRVATQSRHVLEVAAGTGRLTRHLLAVLPADATVVVTDLNEPMLAEARARLADARLQWRVADAQALPSGDSSFDAVLCQFGLMFVPDKLLALREMQRVLRRGATLFANVWNAMPHNAAQHLVHELASAVFPSDPPGFLETPFSMPDPDALAGLARAAGFTEVRVETVAAVAEAASAADFTIGLVRGTPLWHQLVERGVDAAAFEAQVTATLVARFGDSPCRSPLSAHVLTALA